MCSKKKHSKFLSTVDEFLIDESVDVNTSNGPTGFESSKNYDPNDFQKTNLSQPYSTGDKSNIIYFWLYFFISIVSFIFIFGIFSITNPSYNTTLLSDTLNNKKVNNSTSYNLIVTSNIDNSVVFIDNIKSKFSPASYRLTSGRYHIVVKKEGYHSFYKTIKIPNQKRVHASLVKNKIFGNPINPRVEIRSNVNGDTVYIDGKRLGPTPFFVHLPDGNHFIEISKYGYNTYKQHIIVNTNTTIWATLTKNTN